MPGDWYVESLELRNFRCFENITVEFDPQLTVLVGVNGTGKTALLDGAAVMLSTILREFGAKARGFVSSDARLVAHDLQSKESVARLEPQYPVSSTMKATLAGAPYWWRRERSRPSGRTTWGEKNSEVGRWIRGVWESSNQQPLAAPLLPLIGLYGVERVMSRKAGEEIARSRSGAYEAALDAASDLSRLSKYIRALTLDAFTASTRGEDAATASRGQLAAIRAATNQVLSDTGWRDPEWNPLVGELTLTHQDAGTLPLSFLSSGIKVAAGLVLDLASRAARANPGHGAGDLLEQVPGIVLVDEVDLHLHPHWQQRLLPQLRRAFPKVQFIVTTHSPQVLSTVEAQHIRILEDSTTRTPRFSEGLRSDVVLDQVLGTRAEPPLPVTRDLDRYVELVDTGQGSTAEAIQLRSLLDNKLGGISNVRELADADARIAFYDLDL